MIQSEISKIENNNDFFYPPGGILIWIIAFIEILTFMMGLSSFIIQRNSDIVIFNLSKEMLNPYFGLINTAFLVIGGFFMARGLEELKINDNKSSANYILLAIISGFLFLFTKSLEYYQKIQIGVFIDYNDFFTYYWLLTLFHFTHVIIAIGILIYILIMVKKQYYSQNNYFDVESGAIFWHMCDIIWILLFPILYLLK